MIYLYLYQYLLLWDTSYIVGNRLISTFQYKFNHANPFSISWDISRQSFYSYWWPDISIICCHFYTSCIYTNSPHLGLSSATYFVKIGLLVVKIQAEWSLWHTILSLYALMSSSRLFHHVLGLWCHIMWHVMWLWCHVPLHCPKEKEMKWKWKLI